MKAALVTSAGGNQNATSGRLLLVGTLGLHHLLPLHELGEFLVVVSAEVAADGFHYA